MTGCACSCVCHIHGRPGCPNHARPGTRFCYGCLSEHACATDASRANAGRLASWIADERKAGRTR